MTITLLTSLFLDRLHYPYLDLCLSRWSLEKDNRKDIIKNYSIFTMCMDVYSRESVSDRNFNLR